MGRDCQKDEYYEIRDLGTNFSAESRSNDRHWERLVTDNF